MRVDVKMAPRKHGQFLLDLWGKILSQIYFIEKSCKERLIPVASANLDVLASQSKCVY